MSDLDVPSSPWLDQLLGELDELSRQVAAAAPSVEAVGEARDAAAVATMRLDGSPMTDVPTPLDALPVGTATGPARGGWLEVLRSGAVDLEQAPDEVLLAVEHHGARRGLDSVDLSLQLRSDPLAALRELHRRMTEGLLAPETAGAPRQTEQAVHDASIGRVLFFPVDPAHIEPRLEQLATWLATTDAPAAVAAGVLHHQILDLHPFEAANGRLARTASRLLLAAGGIDAELVGQPEAALQQDVIGYLDEVGRSRRLGDPSSFVARWTEAVVDGLRSAAHTFGVAPDVEVPAVTLRFLTDRGAADFTIVDHRSAGGDDAGLDAALRAGLARRLHGTRGLRWRAVTGA